MRGNPFHNMIVTEAREIFASRGWKTFVEYRYRRNNVTTYFDLFAVKGYCQFACEVETTPRHAVDNVMKACSVGIQVWVIVPSRRTKRQIERRFQKNCLHVKGLKAEVLLLGQLAETLTNRYQE